MSAESAGAVLSGATIGRLLEESALARSEAMLLLGDLLGRERTHLIAHAEEHVDAAKAREVRARFARRRAGEPIAYITGRREFYGLDLRITPDVLVPRHETELLVELALGHIPPDGATRVLDLGTGSGAVAIALARSRPRVSMAAADVSAAALGVARGNADSHGVSVEFIRSDWFGALRSRTFDLIVSNPPYVADGDRHLEEGDLRFEPRVALSGGPHGMRDIRSIAAAARDHLSPGGWLLFEHGYDQREPCMRLLRDFGYADAEDFSDLAGLPRVCAGRRPG